MVNTLLVLVISIVLWDSFNATNLVLGGWRRDPGRGMPVALGLGISVGCGIPEAPPIGIRTGDGALSRLRV